MKILCATEGIVNRKNPAQGIADISNAGFENILLDLSMACSAHELEKLEEFAQLGGQYKRVIEHCKKQELQVPVARAPYLLRNTKRTDLNDILLQLAQESIKVCGEVNCTYFVVRPFFAGIEFGKEWEMNRDYYLRLADVARENNVIILLENLCRDLNGHLVRGICSDGTVAAEWVDKLNEAAGEERFGFCMDVGACNLVGQDMQEFINVLGKRLKAVVVRDCNGREENAMLPFTCVSNGQVQTDWLSLIRGLRESAFDGHLIFNIADTSAAFSPLLRPALLVLAKQIADFFKWQIEMEAALKKYNSIVLFGAGNMCRNYMKCYGEKYPPLFTCDNNQKLWGTSFCGLEVKPPEVLKNLSEDCGIFICNIFYREIEAQLRDMGIKNVEFFNDEYMPSFYFDRLKGV